MEKRCQVSFQRGSSGHFNRHCLRLSSLTSNGEIWSLLLIWSFWFAVILSQIILCSAGEKGAAKGLLHVCYNLLHFHALSLEITYKHSGISGEYKTGNCWGGFSINAVKGGDYCVLSYCPVRNSPPCITPMSPIWIGPRPRPRSPCKKVR